MIVAKYIYKFISRAKRQERKELYMEYGILSLAPAFIALVLAFIKMCIRDRWELC